MISKKNISYTQVRPLQPTSQRRYHVSKLQYEGAGFQPSPPSSSKPTSLNMTLKRHNKKQPLPTSKNQTQSEIRRIFYQNSGSGRNKGTGQSSRNNSKKVLSSREMKSTPSMKSHDSS